MSSGTVSDDLRRRRLAVVEEHFRTEVSQEFDKTLATFGGHPHYEIMATGQVFDGDSEVMGYYRTTNERIYFDTASLLSQIGRSELLAVAAGEGTP